MRRTGRQRPTFEVVGSYDFSYGGNAVEAFEEEAGATFDDAQKYEIELFLARKLHGNAVEFAALTIGIAKPRQNGKSYAARWYAVDMALAGMRVLYSAHHSSTTAKMFKEMCAYFEDADNHPEIAAQVLHVSRARGYESIEIDGGGCIDFQTRTNAGGRGGTYDIIIVDEAQELTYDQLEALLPTMSASGHEPQIIYIGTPPGPACLGTVFRDMHDKAHSGDPGSAWWLEWSVQADSIDGIDVNDKDLWYETNPAMGTRIMERTVQNECDTMRRDGFARERLGWWSPTAGRVVNVIGKRAWDALSTEQPPTDGKVAYGVRFAVDGSEVSLCAALEHDGHVHVEQVRRENASAGLTWIADFIAERKDRACICVIDGKSGVQALVDRLERMPKGYVHVASAADATSAATTLVDMVNESRLSWYAPQSDLRDSAVTSVRRNIGNSGSWGFGGENPTPVTAASLAVWGVMTARRDPRRKGLVG